MYLFLCPNHFYCDNNKDSLFFRCNENEVIVAVAINRQYLHTVHFGSQVNLCDGQLFIPSRVRIITLTPVSS